VHLRPKYIEVTLWGGGDSRREVFVELKSSVSVNWCYSDKDWCVKVECLLFDVILRQIGV